jgi:tetratricopeptide (TPR) repeat protein
MKTKNNNNKNTAQFFMVGTQPDGTMGIINSGNVDETLKCASEICRGGHLAKGIYLLKILEKLHPNDPAVVKELAYALIVNCESEAALPYLQRLKQLWPDYAITAALLGMAYKKLGRNADASAALAKAVAATFDGVDSFKAVTSLAMMLNEQLPAVLRLVRKIQQIQPEDQFSWLALGNIHLLRGEKTEAVKAFKRVIQISATSKMGVASLQLLMDINQPTKLSNN